MILSKIGFHCCILEVTDMKSTLQALLEGTALISDSIYFLATGGYGSLLLNSRVDLVLIQS